MKNNLEIEYCTDTNEIPNIHFHNEIEIIYVEKGSSTFLIENKKIVTTDNSIIIISNLENHSMQINSKEYSRYIIKIKNLQNIYFLPSEAYIQIFQNRPDDFPYLFQFNDEEAKKVKYILKTLANEETKNDYSNYYCNLLLNELIIIIFRSSPYFNIKKHSDFENTIYRIQDFINENYFLDIDLDTIENKFFVNKYEVSRNFKKITGYNFKKYLILVRLSKAKELLKNTNLSISEISRKIGYSSESLFIRIFKKYENMTPSSYRNLYLEEIKNVSK